MRNAVVHRYGTVNIELIFENIEEIKRILCEVIEIIEAKLDVD